MFRNSFTVGFLLYFPPHLKHVTALRHYLEKLLLRTHFDQGV